MEIIEKQTIKEVPVDGNYGYGYGRKDINGKANAGLKQLYYTGSKMMIVRVIQNCGIISRKTNYKGQVILPFIFFYLS